MNRCIKCLNKCFLLALIFCTHHAFSQSENTDSNDDDKRKKRATWERHLALDRHFAFNRWKNNTVYYSLEHASERTKVIFADVIKLIQSKSALTFIKINGNNRNNYIEVISTGPQKDSDCNYTPNYPSFLELPDICETRADILHEVMHALGFEHEHQRADRDEYVHALTYGEEFDINRKLDVTNHYDFHSILHYREFFAKNPEPIETNQGRWIAHLSGEDIQSLNNTYPFSSPQKALPPTTATAAPLPGTKIKYDGQLYDLDATPKISIQQGKKVILFINGPVNLLPYRRELELQYVAPVSQAGLLAMTELHSHQFGQSRWKLVIAISPDAPLTENQRLTLVLTHGTIDQPKVETVTLQIKILPAPAGVQALFTQLRPVKQRQCLTALSSQRKLNAIALRPCDEAQYREQQKWSFTQSGKKIINKAFPEFCLTARPIWPTSGKHNKGDRRADEKRRADGNRSLFLDRCIVFQRHKSQQWHYQAGKIFMGRPQKGRALTVDHDGSIKVMTHAPSADPTQWEIE